MTRCEVCDKRQARRVRSRPSRLAWAGAKRSESGGQAQRPGRLCKQEVTGSIPVGST